MGNPGVKFKVIGVGGAGCRMVSRIATRQISSPPAIEYIAMDTDTEVLAVADLETRIQLGPLLLRGLGTGGDTVMGRRAAEESRGGIRQTILGSDIVVLLGSLGGGTGAGAMPVIAEVARYMGILTIGMVATPFVFEGARRTEISNQGVTALLGSLDNLVILPQDILATISGGSSDITNSLHAVTDLMASGIDALHGAVCRPGLINLDITDVCGVLKAAGPAKMTVGSASGNDRAAQAAYAALSHLSLGLMSKGDARVAIFTVTGGNDLSLYEVNSVADIIKHDLDPDAEVIFGVNCDSKMGDEVKVALIMTRFKPGDS
jgi:cell division protein FtsZ